MLHMPQIPSVVTSPRVVTGPQLNKLVKKASPRDRALFAVGLIRGEIQVTGHTLKQATALTGASLGYTITTNRLTPEERTKLERGSISLCRLHLRRRHTDAELDRVVQTYGIDALFQAIDRATAPSGGDAVIHEAAE
jgi:hypothetical protein